MTHSHEPHPKYSTDAVEVIAEIRALPMTIKPMSSPWDGDMTDEDLDLFEGLYIEARDGTRNAIRMLTRLIKKYPQIPILKNHLSSAYSGRGKYREAGRITQQIVEQHPDYLFGKINHAFQLLAGKRGKAWEGVPGILCETLRLTDLDPQEELFHFTEIRGYYCAVSLFHLRAGRIALAGEILDILDELVREDEDPLLDHCRRQLDLARAARLAQVKEDEAARAIRVKSPPLPEMPADAARPDFHHPVIESLYTHGLDMPAALIEEILSLDRATLTADLEAVVRDAIVRVRKFRDDGFESGNPETCFPQHAISLLGELRSVQSLPVVFEFLSQDPEVLFFWFESGPEGSLWQPIYPLLADQLVEAREFVLRPGIPWLGRIIVTEPIAKMLVLEPGRRDELISWLRGILEFLLESPAENNILDTEFIGYFVWQLMDVRAIELLPLVIAHYQRGHVAESLVGDPQEIEAALLGEEVGSAPRAPIFLGMRERYRKFRRERERAHRASPHLVELAVPKIGRNDPCPCGSGKKYKKCCQ